MQQIDAVELSPQDLAELDRRIDDVESGRAELVAWPQAYGELMAGRR